jgi:PKHD-type hydroxylase
MTYFLIHPQTLDEYSTYCFYEKVFTEEECDSIIEIYKTLSSSDAYIGGNEEDGVLDPEMRKSKVGWLSWSNEFTWIFERLTHIVSGANDARNNFQLTGFLEPLQLTEYQAPGSHYGWHQDSGAGSFSIRKLSVVVQLSSPESYEGGELEFFSAGTVQQKDRGTVYVFPSFEQHRVKPVTSGTRYSLVCWVSGPPFR